MLATSRNHKNEQNANLFVTKHGVYILKKATILGKNLIKPYFHENEEVLQTARDNRKRQLMKAIILKD